MKPTPRYASGDVRSPRNSECASARLRDLDFGDWFTDALPGCGIYLHVARHSDDTTHRVYCRRSENARLAMHEETLCWLWEKEPKTP